MKSCYITFVMFMILLLLSFTQADTLHVDNDGSADFTSIQTAIQASNDGDIVLVSPGIYYENIYFQGKAITLTSENPDDPNIIAQTIINGSHWDSVVTFAWGEETTSILTGFTITNGSALYGSGICCWQSSPTIAKNHIEGNRSYDDFAEGAGIYCYLSEAVIQSNVIYGNQLDGDRVAGAGICLIESNSLVIDNIITHNNASQPWDSSEGIVEGLGGGVYCEGSSMTISDNTIVTNSSVLGGGIYVKNSEGIISNNVINDNTANRTLDITNVVPGSYQGDGGGIYIANSGHLQSLLLEHNSIINNRCECFYWSSAGNELTLSSRGGGVFCYSSSVDFISNNIKYNYVTVNLSEENLLLGKSGGGGIFCDSSTANIKDNKIIGNGVYAYGNPIQPVGGGGIYLSNTLNTECSLIIQNNQIATNTTFSNGYEFWDDAKGGGIFCDSYISPEIYLNTIVGNHAYRGGGICFEENSNPLIDNNIIVKNTSGGGVFWKYTMPASFSFNCLWGNIGGNYSGWAAPGEGDISTNPLFADILHKDYHLKSDSGRWDTEAQAWVFDDVTSPCINAGNPASHYKTEPKPNGKRINMGAYGGTEEASKSPDVPVIYCRENPDGDVDGNCMINSSDLLITASRWLEELALGPGVQQDWFKTDVSGFEIKRDNGGNLCIISDEGLAKYDPNGLEIWKYDQYFSPSYDKPTQRIVLDEFENIYCIGQHLEKLDLNGTVLWSVDPTGDSISIDIANNIYAFNSWCCSYPIQVASKYDPNGTELWVLHYENPEIDSFSDQTVNIDKFGNTYLFFNAWKNDLNVFGIVKYDPFGNQLWEIEEVLNEQDFIEMPSVSFDSIGNIYLTYTKASLKDWIRTYAQVVAKYNSEGSLLWQKEQEHVFFYQPVIIETDALDNVYLAGSTMHSGNQPYTIIKYSSEGNVLWTVSYYGDPENYAFPRNKVIDAFVDDVGNVYITGFSSQWDDNLGLYSSFTTLLYNSEGQKVWEAHYPESYYWGDLTVTDTGDIYIVGDSYEEGLLLKYSPADLCMVDVAYDSNSDCNINLEDFAIIAGNWLECNLQPQEACWE